MTAASSSRWGTGNEPSRQEDMAVLSGLHRSHRAYLLAVARRAGARGQDCEDAVQFAFMQVLVLMRDGRGPSSNVRGYLAVCVKNYVRSGGRHREIPYGLEPEDVASDRALPEAVVVGREERDLALLAYSRLPASAREVLFAADVEGAPGSEVAERLGLSESGYYARLSKARDDLRSQFLAVNIVRKHEVADDAAHPSGVDIARWARGSASARLSASVERHLETCPTCGRVAIDAARMRKVLRLTLAPPVGLKPVLGPVGGWLAQLTAVRAAVVVPLAALVCGGVFAFTVWGSSSGHEPAVGAVALPGASSTRSEVAPSSAPEDSAAASESGTPHDSSSGGEYQAEPDSPMSPAPSTASQQFAAEDLTVSSQAPASGATTAPGVNPTPASVAGAVRWSQDPEALLAGSVGGTVRLPFVIESDGSGDPVLVDIMVTLPAGVRTAEVRDGQCSTADGGVIRCGRVMLDGTNRVEGSILVTADAGHMARGAKISLSSAA